MPHTNRFRVKIHHLISCLFHLYYLNCTHQRIRIERWVSISNVANVNKLQLHKRTFSTIKIDSIERIGRFQLKFHAADVVVKRSVLTSRALDSRLFTNMPLNIASTTASISLRPLLMMWRESGGNWEWPNLVLYHPFHAIVSIRIEQICNCNKWPHIYFASFHRSRKLKGFSSLRKFFSQANFSNCHSIVWRIEWASVCESVMQRSIRCKLSDVEFIVGC